MEVDPSCVSLPPAFSLKCRPQAADMIEALNEFEISRQEEGTLLHVDSLSRVALPHRISEQRTDADETWQSPAGNLHLALVLRPDYAITEALELRYLLSASVFEAILELAPPGTRIAFDPEGAVWLNGLWTGWLALAHPGGSTVDRPAVCSETDQSWDFLALILELNLRHHPANEEPECFNSLLSAGADPSLSPSAFIERFARHFLNHAFAWNGDQRDRVVGRSQLLELNLTPSSWLRSCTLKRASEI